MTVGTDMIVEKPKGRDQGLGIRDQGKTKNQKPKTKN